MLSYDDALQLVTNSTTALEPIEMPLPEAAGLVLAGPASARWDMPRCDNSAMDGFAVSVPFAGMASGVPIIGASYAGLPFAGEIKPGQAVRITTGANLPAGANSVVPIEEVEEQDGRIVCNKSPQHGQHVRYRGEEYQAGEILAEQGTRLRAGAIALLASAGVERVRVYPRLRVAVISTGDELVELGQTPGPGQIINSNLQFLQARLHECGCTPVCLGIGSDDRQALGPLIEQALDADLIISTGGVSVGERDQVQAALDNHAFEKIFWKVAIKPGKPLLYGRLGGKPFFGLPGNPGATAATFELFVKPALKRLAGHVDVLPAKRIATLTHDVEGGGNRQAFLWCTLQWTHDRYQVSVAPSQGSGQNRCLMARDALMPVPTDIKSFKRGQQVEVLLIEDL